MKRLLLALSILMVLTQCGRATDFLTHLKSEPQEFDSFYRKVKEVSGTSKLDVLWVIDNSGSMSTHQANVIANTKKFMDAFTVRKNLDWKMGLVSTHEPDAPYLGFTPTTLLDRSTPDPVGTFQAAVGKLGLNKGCPELVFEPVMGALTAYPGFSRKQSVLALIALTDTMEEVAGLQAKFETFLTGHKGDMKHVRFYGAFAGASFKCASGEPHWLYPGSPFEHFVNLTGSKFFDLCDADFGKNLAEIGEDIASTATFSRISLPRRPLPSTLRVMYMGAERKGSSGNEKGDWYYDFDLNAVVFYSLDFAKNDSDEIEIVYEVAK